MSPSKNRDNQTPKQKNKNGAHNMRWTVGLILLFFGIYLLFAVVCYFFDWKTDCSSLVEYAKFKGNPERLALITFENPCGRSGAMLANALIGNSFGLFGIIVPLLIIILALRITRLKMLHLNRLMSIGILVLILGMLTLGFIFKTSWDIFGSGLGGKWGIAGTEAIVSTIGVIGTALLLLGGWILTGVYINRSFIKTVNRAGEVIADSSLKVGKAAIDLVVKNGEKHILHKTSEHEAQKADDQEPVPSAQSETIPAATAPEAATEPEPESDLDNVQPVIDRPDHFTTITEQPIGNDSAREQDFEIVVRNSPDGEDVQETEIENETETEDVAEEAEEVIETPEKREESGLRTFTISDNGERMDNSSKPAAAAGTDSSASSAASGKPSVKGDENGLHIVVIDHKDKEVNEADIDDRLYDPTKDIPKYQRPPVSLLEDHSMDVEVSDEEIFENKEKIKDTLQNFGIAISKIKATVGPTVTLYEIVPAPGIKISKIKSLEDDIAMSLKALGIRIIAPMPGKGTVGIEVPNKDRDVVSMLSAIKSARFQQCNYELPVVLGRTIQNENFVIDLAKMPHLLVAGATGQGKSVGLNAIITSLLYKKHPSELKFVMVDPKRVELSLYAPLKNHFLAKMESEEDAILTDTQKVIYTFNSLVIEMENRYDLLRKASVKKITEYNEKFRNRQLNLQKGHRFMPYIVVVVDEFADLIMTAGREIETPIARLAQMGRAVGLHLIIATQRPEVKVITGLIKSNFPARIAFRVMSMVDSRTIIDQPGANQLIGRGDMLISLNSELTRIQCAFVDTPEIEKIIQFIASQPGYPNPYPLPDYVPENSETQLASSGEAMKFDPLFPEIARWIVQNGRASTSSIQSNFEVGFNRAGRIMNQMEKAGIVGHPQGSKPRDLNVTDPYTLERILQDLGLS